MSTGDAVEAPADAVGVGPSHDIDADDDADTDGDGHAETGDDAETRDALVALPVSLTEPARQRLVTLAADVLGRLPAESVPASLRPFARFAPARRARLGAAALAAALDGDEDFRVAVGEVVAESLPDLAKALHEHGSTAASDPVDVAVVAYLLRPEGWTDIVSAANARWVHEHGPTEDRAELARLRAETAELRARLKSEGARLKEALAAATSDLAAELAEARRQVRDRTRELRAAERARDAAESALSEAQRRSATQESARDAELRRLRARVAELERSAESARRDVRADRDLGDARLWLLVDTLTEAAAGIRRELSLPPPSRRPADSVPGAAASGAVGPGALRQADDVAALDRLLALPNVHLVVDGYNVTKTGYGDLSLAEQRGRLIGALATLAGRSGAEITIAFDGGSRPPAQPPTPRGVRVLFSAPDEIADDLIRRLVAAEPQGRPVVVVTSDQQVVTDVRRAGAWVAPAAVLLARLA